MSLPKRDRGYYVETATEPASVYVPVTPSGTNLALGTCRSILASVAGTVNLVDAEGNTRTNFPLQAGYNPIAAIRISAPSTGTAATGIWALY